MKSISVFCGSSLGAGESYQELAKQVGATLAQQNIRVIYGGASIGLMGLVADSALANNGEVIGVLPKVIIEREIAHEGLTELITCNTMHERKQKMFELSDGFIALPGGFGTFDEICEILTWRQLGTHNFPIGFLNHNGYYDNLKKQVEHSVEQGFIQEAHGKFAVFAEDLDSLLAQMQG